MLGTPQDHAWRTASVPTGMAVARGMPSMPAAGQSLPPRHAVRGSACKGCEVPVQAAEVQHQLLYSTSMHVCRFTWAPFEPAARNTVLCRGEAEGLCHAGTSPPERSTSRWR